MTANDLMGAFNVFGRILGEQLEKGFEGIYSRLDSLNPDPPLVSGSETRKKKRSSFPDHRTFDRNHMAVSPLLTLKCSG